MKPLEYILCVKQQIYSFWMVHNKFIVEQLIKLHEIIDDLENIGVKNDDEDKDLLLLS